MIHLTSTNNLRDYKIEIDGTTYDVLIQFEDIENWMIIDVTINGETYWESWTPIYNKLDEMIK